MCSPIRLQNQTRAPCCPLGWCGEVRVESLPRECPWPEGAALPEVLPARHPFPKTGKGRAIKIRPP